MAVETLHDLWLARGRIHVRCGWGRREGLKSVRECSFRLEPDLMTLMLTRGRRCQLSDLNAKFRCPLCGSWKVTVGITVPGAANSAAQRRSLP